MHQENKVSNPHGKENQWQQQQILIEIVVLLQMHDNAALEKRLSESIKTKDNVMSKGNTTMEFQ